MTLDSEAPRHFGPSMKGDDMASIWEATCKCGSKTRVELRGQAGDRVLRVGCVDHWFELPAEGLKAALAKAEKVLD